MSKVVSSALKNTGIRKILVNYTSSDIAIGVVIAIQCSLALSVILYHLI